MLVVEGYTNLRLQVFLQCQETYLIYGGNINMELEAESLLATFHAQRRAGSSINTIVLFGWSLKILFIWDLR